MTKLTLNPAPTFTAPVEIPLPDGQVAKHVFTFKHRSREAFHAFMDDKGMNNTDMIEGMCSGWDLDEEFNRENIERLCSQYMMAPIHILNAYTAALVEGRRGN